jgi:probable F420-dependent oxidoreductase
MRPLDLGRFGVWLSPIYDDDTRVNFVVEAEALGYPTAWLAIGRRSMPDLELIERAVDATTKIVIATGVVNMWNNEADAVATSYRRIADQHPDRFLLGLGIGHRESISGYRAPYDTMVVYLDRLDAGGVPPERRILAALGPRALRLARDRAAGTHPYLVGPAHTRAARDVLGPGPLLAPEHTVVIETDTERARQQGREFLQNPYLSLSNYVNNMLRHGFSPEDVADGGSDHLIDSLVLHGTPEVIATGLDAHLEAGANHVAVQVLAEDQMDAFRQLAPLLVPKAT